MLTMRLPKALQNKLNAVAALRKVPKSKVVKEALEQYFQTESSPYELGKDLFGKYSSNTGNLSATYKKILKEKLNEKHAH